MSWSALASGTDSYVDVLGVPLNRDRSERRVTKIAQRAAADKPLSHGRSAGEWIPIGEDDELKDLRGDPEFEALVKEQKARAQAQ